MTEKDQSLENSAWAAFNTAFASHTPSVHRSVGHELYRQAKHEEVERAFAKSDQQNLLIDMALGVEVRL